MFELDGEFLRADKVSWIGKVLKDDAANLWYFQYLVAGRHKMISDAMESVVRARRSKLVYEASEKKKPTRI